MSVQGLSLGISAQHFAQRCTLQTPPKKQSGTGVHFCIFPFLSFDFSTPKNLEVLILKNIHHKFVLDMAWLIDRLLTFWPSKTTNLESNPQTFILKGRTNSSWYNVAPGHYCPSIKRWGTSSPRGRARLKDTHRDQCAPCLVEMSDVMLRMRAESETSLPGSNSQASGMMPGHKPSYRHHCREKVVHQHCTESPLEHGLTG